MAQQVVPGVRFRFDAPPLQLRTSPLLEDGALYGRRVPVGLVVDRWLRTVQRRIAADREVRQQLRLLGEPPIPDTTLVAPPPIAEADSQPAELSTLEQLADLNIELNARVETRVDRLKNLNCTAQDISNPALGCQGGFPTPTLDPRFDLRAGGVIAERLHVNVDFDPDREFSANNTINFWFQGFEDEIIRRVEVGNLDFRLPSSRFITSAIPANSFGVQADAQIGPVELRAILAQQKGTSVRSRVFTIGDQTTQTVERETRDLEFESGRFFFVVRPTELPNYPAVDVLNIRQELLDPTLRPEQVRVYRLRAQSGQVGSSPNLGGIDAVAVRADSPQRVGPFPWELLVEGIDYFLDPSGVWFALRNRVGEEEYLAVSYVTATGDTVGTFPSVNSSGDTLELIHEPRRGPDVPTFDYAMRNVYRVGGGDISRATIALTLLVNDSERPLDGVGTYLARLGLARSTDPSLLDGFNRVFPRERDPNGGEPIRDLFVVFPHLTPFGDSASLLPGERNDSLYLTPTYLLRTEGPPVRFQLRWSYEATGSGDRSSLSLGAIQVQQGSERLFLDGRELVRGRDYQIAYDLGVVTFANPDTLFNGPAQVRVQFEENQLFDIHPRNVVGVGATYNLGSRGRIDAVGLFQRERSPLTRPQLGFEPQGMFMAGINADFAFRADWLTKALDAIPLLNTNVPSTLEINGEIALSRPNPNSDAQAYVEEFEGESALPVSMQELRFQLGSRPLSGQGVPAQYLGLGGEFEADDAVPLVWQNAIEVNGGPLELGAEQIDTAIVLTGAAQQVETLLWLTLKPDTVGGAPHPVTGAPRWVRPMTPSPRWRSITQPLDPSGLGVDLSRVEFLEFWLLEDFGLSARRQQTALIVDFGTVLEDALAFGPDAFVVTGADTVFSGFQYLGEGVLDAEKDPVTNVFYAATHDVGIHGDLLPTVENTATLDIVRDLPTCEQGFTVGIPVFPLGSLNARCTRQNGNADTEDLNGDNRLDTSLGPAQEDVLRHFILLGDDRYVVKTGVTLTDINGRAFTWRLYRVPFRENQTLIGSPNLRQIRSLRLTVATPGNGTMEEEVSFAVARMRLLGAPWVKRADVPLEGLGGLQPATHGQVSASVISTDNEDLGYVSPPGAPNEAERKGAALEFTTQQINERSLRLIATDLRVGERAEAFVRFADEADKNFLKYRRLRVWARGRGPGWLEGDLEFFIKVGRDEDNFYMYKTTVSTTDWLPEVVIDLNRWTELRSGIEAAWLSGQPPGSSCGGDPDAYVACDGPYLVHIRDPGVAPPNLARVSEVAAGIYRSFDNVVVPEAELWVDDIRLSDIVDDVGVANAIEAKLTAADFAEITFARTSVDDRFRQLDEVPDYQGRAATTIGSTVRLDKLFPSSVGLSIPFQFQRQQASTDPLLVRRSDVFADSLPNLRRPESSSTLYQIGLRRTRRGATFIERVLADPVAITAARLDANEVTELSSARSENRRVRVDYNLRPVSRSIAGAPGFLVRMVDKLPAWIRDSEFGRALRTSRLRLNPHQIRVVSTLTDNITRRSTFRVPVELADDSTRPQLNSTVHTWRNELGVDVRPFSSLGLRLDYVSTRDLQNYGDSTSVGRLLDGDRRTFFGRDVGFERDRVLETSLSVSPVINSWLRPSVTLSSDFIFHRDPNADTPVRTDLDATMGFKVPEALANRRTTEIVSTFDLARLVTTITGPDHPVARAAGILLPTDVRYRRELRSTFDRARFEPTLRYQLALGSTDRFRSHEGELATSAVESDEWIVAGGARLPLGFRVRANFRNTEANTWTKRGNTQALIIQKTREWPSTFVTWVYTPNWSLRRLLSTITAQGQCRGSDASSFQPPRDGSAGTGVLAQTNRTMFTPSLTLTWTGGIVTTAEYSRTRSDVMTSGNLTRSDETAWGGTLAFAARAPSWLVRLPSDVRTTLALSSRDVFVCLRRAGTDDCSPVSDSRRRQADVRVDTAFPPNMRGGASFSYILTDQRATSSKISQMIFSVFVDINFLASQIR